MNLNWNLVLLTGVLFFSIEAFADTFLLKNGKKIYGTQVEKTKKTIVYKDANGTIKTIPLAQIKTITIDKKADTAKVTERAVKTEKKTDSSSKVEELMEKVAELTAKVDELTLKTKEQDAKNKEQFAKATEAHAKEVEKKHKEYISTGGYKSVHPHPTEPAPKDDAASIELTTEIVSDFIWRGNSYGGEYLSRRNNAAYTGNSQYWAFQPNLRINAPISGLYMEIWGNFALVGRTDRDSDMRLFQASPGAAAIDPTVYFAKLDAYFANPTTNPVNLLYDPSNNVVNNKCASDGAGGCSNPDYSFVDPRKIGKHKEKNGMARSDGVFTTFAYNFQNKKFGDITWGIWFYYQLDKNAKYSWDEYFIFWGLPFLQQVIKPTISLYTQSSFDFGSIYAGGHYLSFAVSHTFFEGKFFRIQPASNLGYKYQNNNIDQKSGFYDLTTNLKFFFGDFFFSLNHVLRPNLYMYDSDTWYYPLSQGSQSQTNRSNYDGKTVDPSKLYGVKNEAVYSAINQLDVPDIVKNYAKEQYQSQKIVQHLFYISFGYNFKF
jgi:hypothetical protein